MNAKFVDGLAFFVVAMPTKPSDSFLSFIDVLKKVVSVPFMGLYDEKSCKYFLMFGEVNDD